jgi:type I restriction enzyme R subunit
LLSANFGFLEPHGAQLYRLAALAEHYFSTDANTCLLKLRQFAELLAQDVAARASLFTSTEEPFVDLLGRLSRSGYVPRQPLDLFHHLRRAGNAAAHVNHDDHRAALSALKVARELGVWFVRSFGKKPKLSLGPFTPPAPPSDPNAALLEALQRLQAELDQHRSETERHRARAEELEARSRTAEEKAAKEAEERAIWQSLAEDAEARAILPLDEPAMMRRLDVEFAQNGWEALELEAETASTQVQLELEALQQQAEQLPAAARASIEQEAARAAEDINLDEAATRAIIDEQLRQVGWDADTETLRHASGTRPIKGRNLAISEWPTASGPADYALFAGLKLLGWWRPSAAIGTSWRCCRRRSAIPQALPLSLMRSLKGRHGANFERPSCSRPTAVLT